MAGFIVQHVDYQTVQILVVGFASNLEIARRMARNSGYTNAKNVGHFEVTYVTDGALVDNAKFCYLDTTATPGMED